MTLAELLQRVWGWSPSDAAVAANGFLQGFSMAEHPRVRAVCMMSSILPRRIAGTYTVPDVDLFELEAATLRHRFVAHGAHL